MSDVEPGRLDTGELRGWVSAGGPRRVLMLHGGPAIDYRYLDALRPELDGWTVAAFQQRGLAPSTLEGPFDVATAVSDVAAFLDELGWDRDVYLLGHSWGGHLALHVAVRFGERLAGVLAVDPLGAVGDGGGAAFEEELFRRLPPGDLARVEEIGDTDDDDLADESLRLLWPCYFSTREAAPPYPSPAMSQTAFHDLMRDADERMPGLEAALPAIAVPVGVVMGGASPMPVSAGSDVVARVPGAWFEVAEGAGHFVWLEAPGVVRRALDRLAGEDE